MKWFKTFVTLALVALWLPAMNHCRLEQIPGFAFLVCCDHEDAAPHQDDDCATDGCDVVENGLFKTETSRVTVAAPSFLPLPALVASLIASISPSARPLPQPESVPPDFPRSWQFSLRTALPPRAPSAAS